MTPPPNTFFSAVFCRMIRRRLGNPTWQAENLVVPERFAHLRCFDHAFLLRASGSEDLAYDVFEHDFGRLPEDWQVRLSGKTRQQWLDAEKSARSPRR